MHFTEIIFAVYPQKRGNYFLKVKPEKKSEWIWKMMYVICCSYIILKWILFLRSRFWWFRNFDVIFDCFKEDIVTSIFRMSFHIWLQKHSKTVFINRNNANLLVARRFKQWLTTSGCQALLPSLANSIFSSLHPL